MPDGIMPWLYKTYAGIEESDYREHQAYRDKGGHLSLDAWLKGGKPSPPAQVSPKAKGVLEPLGLWPAGMPTVAPSPAEQIRAAQEAAEVDLAPTGLGAPGFETFKEAQGSLPNENWEVYKNEFGRFDIRRKAAPAPMPKGLTPEEERRYELRQEELEQEKTQWETEQERQEMEWQEQRIRWDWERQQAGQVSPYQEQQFGLQEQQFGLQQQQFEAGQQQFQQQLAFQQAQAQAAQEEQQQRYMSQLQAQPINWLQYAAYTGEQPVVQPWMVPLGAQGGETQLQVGQPIPGVQGRESFANLPQLRTPSAQLQARWGPTAQAQFLGYRQARTGAAPEETQFRLGAGRAPTGRFGGFSRFR